jgi:hypothetical protein
MFAGMFAKPTVGGTHGRGADSLAVWQGLLRRQQLCFADLDMRYVWRKLCNWLLLCWQCAGSCWEA